MKSFTKKLIFSFLFLFFCIFFNFSQSVEFRFKHTIGDCTSHVSTVDEKVYLNGQLKNHTQFINRTSTTIQEVYEDGSALLFTNYMTTQNTLLQGYKDSLSWGEENSVIIKRNILGQLYESQNQFLPTVRSVPSFVVQPVKIGESWETFGLEVHDCRDLFGMDIPLEIPFKTTYTFLRTEQKNGFDIDIILADYQLYQQAHENGIYKNSIYKGTVGYAKQTIYWNRQKGDIENFNEEFEITMYDVFNNQYRFLGKSKGEVTEYKSLNNEQNVQKIQNAVNDLHFDDINVKQDEKGLTISIENIQFEADSSILKDSEKIKLQRIGELLQTFSNDLLITGHCADRGSKSSQQLISEQRANAVANFLIEQNIRSSHHIFSQGKGASQPLDTNSTEEGRKRNRRVEITIMD